MIHLFNLLSWSNLSLVPFLLFVPACIGLTSLLIDGAIFETLRALIKKKVSKSVYKVFECPQCMGFWTGVFSGLVLLSFNPFVLILCGSAGSFFSVLSERYATYLEAATFINLPEEHDSK